VHLLFGAYAVLDGFSSTPWGTYARSDLVHFPAATAVTPADLLM